MPAPALPRHTCLLALLVLVAGCGGPTTPTPDPDAGLDPATVPGVDQNGTVDASTLAGAHADALADRSFTAERHLLVRYENGTVRREVHTVTRTAANRTRYLRRANVSGTSPFLLNGSAGTYWLFADGERVYRSISAGNRTESEVLRRADGGYRRPRTTFPGDPSRNDRLRYVLSNAATTDVRTDGDVVVLSGRLSTENGVFAGPNRRDVRNATYTARVGPDGRLRELALRYEATAQGSEVTVSESLTVFGVGRTDIVRPAWVVAVTENATTAAPSDSAGAPTVDCGAGCTTGGR
jgi:hypothetical protein